MSAKYSNKSFSISVLKGVTATLPMDDHEITVWGSSWTGMEKVWIDNALVSEKRSLKFKTIHAFQLDGFNYELELSVIGFWKGEVSVSLIKDGAHEKTVRFSGYRDDQGKFKWGQTIGYFAAGLLTALVGISIFEILFK